MAVDYYINETSRHAHYLLPPRHVFETGNFYIDEEVLERAGEKDFARYAVTPGEPLFQDLFV